MLALALMQVVTSDAANPLVVAGYVLGFVIAIPVIVVLVKAIFFVATASSKLDATAASCDKVEAGFKDFRHDMRNQVDALDKRVFLVEHDVDRFVPIHPDSRIGRSRIGDRLGMRDEDATRE